MENNTETITLTIDSKTGLWLGGNGEEYFFRYSGNGAEIEEDKGLGALGIYSKNKEQSEVEYFEIIETEFFEGEKGGTKLEVSIKLKK